MCSSVSTAAEKKGLRCNRQGAGFNREGRTVNIKERIFFCFIHRRLMQDPWPKAMPAHLSEGSFICYF